MVVMTTVAPFGTTSLNCPSRSVVVPFVVPFCTTPAPIIGSSCSSTTRPVRATFCANVVNVAESDNTRIARDFITECLIV